MVTGQPLIPCGQAGVLGYPTVLVCVCSGYTAGVHVCLCLFVCVRARVCARVCEWVSHTHTHTHTHTQTHTHMGRAAAGDLSGAEDGVARGNLICLRLRRTGPRHPCSHHEGYGQHVGAPRAQATYRPAAAARTRKGAF